MKARYWCFTWNNFIGEKEEYDNFDFEKLRSSFGKNCSYLVASVERGESGNVHLQGYVEFLHPRSMAGLLKCTPGAHYERRSGTPREASDYCKKEETRLLGPYEWGNLSEPEQGKRNDLVALKESIDAKKTMEELWDDHFGSMVRYTRGIQEYLQLKSKFRNWPTKFEVRIGPPGTGKTTETQLEYPDAYWKSCDSWWDGYTGQDVVVLDEFTGWLPWGLLLRLGDSTPLAVDVKGKRAQFLAHTVVLISNKLPEDWYKYGELKLPFKALERRIGLLYYHVYDKEPEVFHSYDEFRSFYESAIH